MLGFRLFVPYFVLRSCLGHEFLQTGHITERARCLHAIHLLVKIFDLALPVAIRAEVRKGGFKCPIFPAARNPRTEVNHAKCAQRLNQSKRGQVKLATL